MIWIICFVISLLILLTSIVLFIRKRWVRRSGFSTAVRVLFIGFFFALSCLLIPIQLDNFAGEVNAPIKAVLMSLNRTLRSFVLTDINYMNRSMSIAPELYDAYSLLLMLLCFACPLISLSYILSFFSRVRASVGFMFSFRREMYVFSQLNENSVALASDISAHHKGCRIVFCNVNDKVRSQSSHLIHSAELIHAICFGRDILSVDFKAHSKKKRVVFFTIGDDEQRNTSDALELIGAYKEYSHMMLYLFSGLTESCLAIANVDSGAMRVRRIDRIRTLVFRFLYDRGEELFTDAYESEQGEKKISVAVVGVGRYGGELIKALTWYCQMDGYSLSIEAFDRRSDALDKLKAECPELLDDAHNGKAFPGEAVYTVTVHTGVDVKSTAFAEQIAQLSHPTMAFVALGDDSVNIDAAVTLRTLFARSGVSPALYAVIADPEKTRLIKSVSNFKGQPYDIRCVGDIRSSYTEREIIGSEIEQGALRLHRIRGDEQDFWRYEYNYLSSMARAIHRKARISTGQLPTQDEENEASMCLEHKRWNAFIRSQGYVYSGSTDRATRNDLAKKHNDLVPFDLLSSAEKEKDRDNPVK